MNLGPLLKIMYACISGHEHNTKEEAQACINATLRDKEKLQVGTKLYGYCNGYFHADYYETKVVEAFGIDWIVAREEDGYPNFALFHPGGLAAHWEDIQKWMEELDEQ